MYRYIDTHAHLDFIDFRQDREKVIADIFASGCIAIVNPGIDIASSHAALELANHHPHILAGVGIHPHEAIRYIASGNDIFDIIHRDIETIRMLADKHGVVAIGECGLDYYRFKADSSRSKIVEIQKELFQLQLEVAKEKDLPVIVHIREAFEDALEILDLAEHIKRGVAHCYEGSWKFTEVLLSKGFSFGFTANITYPKKDELLEVIKKIPIERIVLETDAPFLSPQPLRGQRNDSRSVVAVGEMIAKIKEIDPVEVFRQTTTNAIELFSLPVLE